ncbi:glucose-like phosphotransferase system IIB component [Vibrio sp. ES.051]|uniref:glucose PTS transporter subunit EIIB n=1 Tax=Vibrio sp. ES.051 TaxID=1761909 RepID=UPI000BF9F27B|nr:glucose PTS transporter subunit EIIB [Vibrio sp. ES.051]PFG58571.1 glucose-like phosphotransferase system IIB component [Vibrio sp. ES.051]
MKVKSTLKHLFSVLTQTNPNIEQDVDAVIAAIGGMKNILETGACATRLRLTLQSTSMVNKEALKKQGAHGVVILDDSHAQIIYGLKANTYSQIIEERMQS